MTTLPLRPDLEGKHPYGAPQMQVKACLNVNENPYSPPQEVCEAIAEAARQAAQTMNRYPERDFWELRQAIADYLCEESGVELKPEQIWAANGSNEIMLQLFQAYGGQGRSCMTFTPSYSMYPEYAQTTSTKFLEATRQGDFTIDVDRAIDLIEEERPALVLLASPNNPTGTALPLDEVRQLAEVTRSTGPQDGTATILVIDEAYGEFRRDGVPSALELLNDFPHLVVSRTMSKAFAAAGLRVGYMAASEQLVQDIQIVRLPYHLSAITQAVALAAINHREGLQAQVADLRVHRDQLVQWLKDKGIDTCDTDANFVLFGCFKDRHAVFQALLDRGILIREVGPEGYLRVSVGTEEENTMFTTALEEILDLPIGARHR